MGVTPNKPGMQGIEREEGRSMPVPSEKGPVVADPRKAGVELEEDWMSLATGDPAFWLKEV